MMATIAEKLSCPMCLDTIKDATLLNCGHSFCRRCIRRYDVSQPELRDHMACPICRKITVWTENRVDDLASNIVVNNVLDSHRRNQGKSGGFNRPIDCDNCDRLQLRAKHYCKECQKFMCDVCLKSHAVSFKYHSVERLLDIITQIKLNSIPTQEELMEDIQLKIDEATLRCKTKIKELRENRSDAVTIEEQRRLINELMKKLEDDIHEAHERAKKRLLADQKRVTEEIRALDLELNGGQEANASADATGDQSGSAATAGTND